MSDGFFDRIAVKLDGRELGAEDDWTVPIVLFNAKDGFGEETWIDEMPKTVLTANLSRAPVRHRSHRRNRDMLPGENVALHVKGQRYRYMADAGIRFAHLRLDDRLLDHAADMAGVPPLSGRLRDDFVFLRDPPLEDRMFTYVRRAADPRWPPSSLEAEALGLLILDQLLALHGARPRPARGGLAAWQARRLIDYLDDHLSRDVSLGELAGFAGLSPNHLCTAFRRATGLPPHRWLTVRRIERAQAMLLDPRHSVTDVAFACGFGSSAHFATTFRKHVGASPSAWRRERLE